MNAPFTDTASYIPGHTPNLIPPLGRFLPPTPAGIGRTWLKARYPEGTSDEPGQWILDPFGASPALAIELARAGYRVLVTANNPIVRFLLEMQATPPNRDELLAVLETLASARKGDPQTGERLEPHLLNLYATSCAQCGADIFPDAFLWEKDAESPFACIYTCPRCDSSGEFPTTGADAAHAARYSQSGLHRARALERVLPLNDPDREHVEEALRVYPPRAVYALFTLINKLDGLPITPHQRNLLAALLLTTFDQTNTLWPHPTARARPKQLTVPPKFIERNVWRALEAAVDAWDWPDARTGASARATSLVHWPQLPLERGGIALFEGRLKDLADSLPPDIAAVVTAIPRPNQAFWTLSALWAGWLWGQEAMGPFRSVLRRRRYDWTWHTEALHAVLRRLSPRLAPGTPLFALLPEAEPGLLTSALVAADMARLALDGVALRDGDELAQITWKTGGSAETMNLPDDRRAEIVRQSAYQFLRARGEPVPYLSLQAAALTELARQDALVPPVLEPGDAYASVRDLLEKTFTAESGLARLGGSPHALDVGRWWLEDTDGAEMPLSDQVEMAVAKFLVENPGRTLVEIDAAMCGTFPGLLTPEHGLVCACLESYGERHPLAQHPVDSGWYLRGQDRPNRRAGDVEEMRGILIELGERLGYSVTSFDRRTIAAQDRLRADVVWSTHGEEGVRFGIQVSAGIGKMTGEPSSTPFAFLVIPGGRANLLMYKIRHDPRLAGGGWQFLKFRHVRQIADSAELTPENWQERFALDPLTYESAQMRLL
ncbi:MAG TPA: hypothetical protein VI451_04660 [Anaerolineales bacterium]|nr:hypothetical protein [Anaerolineales bacterium]